MTETLIRAYFDVFNRHDVEALLAEILSHKEFAKIFASGSNTVALNGR